MHFSALGIHFSAVGIDSNAQKIDSAALEIKGEGTFGGCECAFKTKEGSSAVWNGGRMPAKTLLFFYQLLYGDKMVAAGLELVNETGQETVEFVRAVRMGAEMDEQKMTVECLLGFKIQDMVQKVLAADVALHVWSGVIGIAARSTCIVHYLQS